MTCTLETYQNFLHDIGLLVKEEALASKQEQDKHVPGEPDGYHIGRLIAWHTVISLMQEQATVFGISLVELCLEDIIPERDLV